MTTEETRMETEREEEERVKKKRGFRRRKVEKKTDSLLRKWKCNS